MSKLEPCPHAARRTANAAGHAAPHGLTRFALRKRKVENREWQHGHVLLQPLGTSLSFNAGSFCSREPLDQPSLEGPGDGTPRPPPRGEACTDRFLPVGDAVAQVDRAHGRLVQHQFCREKVFWLQSLQPDRCASQATVWPMPGYEIILDAHSRALSKGSLHSNCAYA